MERYWIELAIALVTVASTVIASTITGRVNAARFTGAANQKFISIGIELHRLGQVDRDQWKAISAVKDDVGEVAEKVARVEGRLNGKAHSAGT